MFDWQTSTAIVLSGLLLLASIYWWYRFSRMMDDVHEIAKALTSKKKATPEDIMAERIDREAWN